MKITHVEYKRLVSFGNYENQTIGAVAEVVDGEDAGEILDQLKMWVIDETAKVVVCADLKQQASDLEYRRDRAKLEADTMIRQAKDRWEATKTALLAHGVDVSDLEIPF